MPLGDGISCYYMHYGLGMQALVKKNGGKSSELSCSPQLLLGKSFYEHPTVNKVPRSLWSLSIGSSSHSQLLGLGR